MHALCHIPHISTTYVSLSILRFYSHHVRSQDAGVRVSVCGLSTRTMLVRPVGRRTPCVLCCVKVNITLMR